MFATESIRRGITVLVIVMALQVAACSQGDDDPTSASAANDAGADSRAAPGAGNDPDLDLDRAVDAETLPYAEVEEELVYGHFTFPSDMVEPLPAIILVHDWWGLNDDIRSAASRLAAEGYMVLAVDLYAGETVDNPIDARARMIAVVENPKDVEANLRQALGFVDIAGAPKKAILGWGFGGGWSLNSTMMFPEALDAAVIFYGQVSNDEDRLRAISAPILGLFGGRDRSIKVESVQEFEEAMQRLRKQLSVQVYPEVGHAFADPARNYNATIAEDAWRRTLEFFAENLSETDES